MKLRTVVFTLSCLLFISHLAYSVESPKEAVVLSLPGLNWILEIEVPDFAVSRQEISDDRNSARFFARNEKTTVIMSAFIEKTPKAGTSKDARAYYWSNTQQSPVKMDDIKMSEFGDIAILEYIIKEYQGVNINQKHLNAYLAKDNCWIDVHLSKTDFKLQDQVLFETVLKNIKINESYKGQKYRMRYKIPQHGELTLNVPKYWVSEMRQPPDDLQPTISFQPQTGVPFKILITAMWNVDKKKSFNSPEAIKSFLEETGNEALSSAVEEKLNLQLLKGTPPQGYYYTLTDKAPKGGEYKYLTQGGIGTGDLLLVLTILYNDKETEAVKDALEMFSSAEQTYHSPLNN